MRESGLRRLAKAAGLSIEWTDAGGASRSVGSDTLKAVLASLDLPADNRSAIKDSLERLRKPRKEPLLVAKADGIVRLPVKRRRVCLRGEDGRRHEIAVEGGKIRVPREPGYYQLEGDDQTIAVIPSRAYRPERRVWGVGAQIYALRDGTTPGFGDFAALARFCESAAALGAGAVAISPVHALFGARPGHISPYAPSTRLWLNPLYAALPRRAADIGGNLIDWPRAGAGKLRALRAMFARRQRDPDFDAFVREGGERLLAHARFEVLDARFLSQGRSHWRDWPEAFREPASRAVAALTADDPDVAFQLFLQWLADRSLAAAQMSARRSGMAVGLIADMAVGMDPAGSHAWSAPDEVLRRLTVGAPPDLFNKQGQNWGLTTLAPHALIGTGYSGFVATLRAAMRHAGGVRLDHAMGLERLWVIPEGTDASEGVYLRYPCQALLGLIALESQRHRALVVAEDLGTVPAGFRDTLSRSGILGMRVLWFERKRNGEFRMPRDWDREAAALSTTHDLPTLAGWWRGRDIDWRQRVKQESSPGKARKVRARDRRKLWRMLKQSGGATGPFPESATIFIDAVFAALAAAPSPLRLLPLEDFLGETAQPNIPGTIDEHPNWRRRLPRKRSLTGKAARRRAAMLNDRP